MTKMHTLAMVVLALASVVLAPDALERVDSGKPWREVCQAPAGLVNPWERGERV
jgi:hypothetical protein